MSATCELLSNVSVLVAEFIDALDEELVSINEGVLLNYWDICIVP